MCFLETVVGDRQSMAIVNTDVNFISMGKLILFSIFLFCFRVELTELSLPLSHNEYRRYEASGRQ